MRSAKLHFMRDRPQESESRFWDRQLRARIGRDLRAVIEEALEEPLPERISRVLDQMDDGTGVGRLNDASDS